MSDETNEAPQSTAEAAPAPAQEDKTTAESMIPRARLNEVIGERDSLREQLEALRVDMQKLQPYEEQVNTLTAQLEQVRALSRVGIVDDDGQAVAGMLFERLAEKPEGGIAAWLAGFEDPSTAPTPLRPSLAPEAPKSARESTPRPDPNQTAVAAVDGRLSPEALADVNRRAMRGDKDAHDAIRRHMLASGYL